MTHIFIELTFRVVSWNSCCERNFGEHMSWPTCSSQSAQQKNTFRISEVHTIATIWDLFTALVVWGSGEKSDDYCGILNSQCIERLLRSCNSIIYNHIFLYFAFISSSTAHTETSKSCMASSSLLHIFRSLSPLQSSNTLSSLPVVYVLCEFLCMSPWFFSVHNFFFENKILTLICFKCSELKQNHMHNHTRAIKQSHWVYSLMNSTCKFFMSRKQCRVCFITVPFLQLQSLQHALHHLQ